MAQTSKYAPSVLLIGAGGAFGIPLLQEFTRQQAKFARIAVLSAPGKVEKFGHLKDQGIEVIAGSFLDEHVYKGFSTVVSVVGNDLMAQQVDMFRAAISAGVEHIYPSEYNSDLSQPELRKWRYFRDKYIVRDFLMQEAIARSGVKTTYLETGIFTEWAASKPYGIDTEIGVAMVYGRGENRLCVTSIPDIAKYLVESTFIPFPDSTSERTIRVVGEELTFQHLIDKLGKVQGKRYDCTYLNPDEAKQKEIGAKELGDVKAEMSWSLRPLAASGFAVVVGGGVDNHKFNFRPENVEETFKRIYKSPTNIFKTV